jgi:hypothetical protein
MIARRNAVFVPVVVPATVPAIRRADAIARVDSPSRPVDIDVVSAADDVVSTARATADDWAATWPTAAAGPNAAGELSRSVAK